ncbi:MAG: hypothetical protein NVS2B12_42140 [Ktedonobacteraceae bacterium]
MRSPRGLHIGLFEEDQSSSVYLLSLLSLAGHKVSLHSRGETGLINVLTSIIDKPDSPPYDLLIIHLWPGSLPPDSTALMLLQKVDANHVLPVIVLAVTRREELRRLQARLPHTPVLSQHPLLPLDLFETISALTGITLSHNSLFFKALQKIQQEQQHARKTKELAWIDRREQWLDQREEWLSQREEWLHEREEWIEVRRQQPQAQQEWLQEQQAWIDQQHLEVQQQRSWAQHLRLWLDRYRNTFDQKEPPSISEAN